MLYIFMSKVYIRFIRCLFVCLFAALEFELRAYTLSHSTGFIFCDGFF
jgi:hypothetical protein